MIINDFDVMSLTLDPAKADAPLVIDPNRVLSQAIAAQCLQAIARRGAKVIQPSRVVQQKELAPDNALKRRETSNRTIVKKAFRVALSK